jgi:photosystem II stability/assembly factor-like uncharacterized protein
MPGIGRSVPRIALSLLLALSALSVDAAEWARAPLFGADVRSLAVDPADPDRVFAGTSGGQLYVSHDGGAEWQDAGPALPFPGWVISALLFDPDRPERLWVAARGVYGGGLVAFTEDGGATWTLRRRGLEEQMIFSLARVAGDPAVLYVGTRDGVYGTTDGGRSWSRLSGAVPELQKVTSLAVDPRRPESVLAGSWRRTYRSDDAGRTWYGVFDGMIEDTEVFAMRAVPGRPGELWASTCGWVYHGVDWGSSWKRFKPWPFERRRTLSLAVASADRLFAGTVDGLEVSADGGASWERRGPRGAAVLAVAWDARRPQRVLIGLEGPGVWRSEDGGASFAPAAHGLTNLRVSQVVSTGGEVYAAVRDAGPRSGIWRRRDGAAAFVREDVDLPRVLDLANAAGRVLAATEGGLYERRGSEWRRVQEVGPHRVGFLDSGAGGTVVATRDNLYRLVGERFEQLPYRHGAPTSIAVLPDGVWVTDATAIYRLQGAANHTVQFPGSRRGRLVRLGSRLLWNGEDGLFQRSEEGTWSRLSDGARRALETGDSRAPLALIDTAGELELVDAMGVVERRLQLPVPGDRVSAAAIHDGTLLLATNGQGLWSLDLQSAASLR